MEASLISIHNTLKLAEIQGSTDKEFPKRFISNIYDPILGHLKTQSLKMLEIGVRGGGSTRLWLSYFENIHLFVMDNGEQLSNEFKHEFPQMNKLKFIEVDAYSKKALSQIPDDFDVMIDDGPHTLVSQKFSRNTIVRNLKAQELCL